uniref:Rho-GAP domain-containing protein n=1 Tax=Plectus sambesii TaxID=2011161 RepID=A0A914X5Q7_9BILA
MATPPPSPVERKLTSPARKKSSFSGKRASLSRIFFSGRRQSSPRETKPLMTVSNNLLINGSSDPMLPGHSSRDSSPTLLSVSTAGTASATTSPIALRKMQWRRRAPFFFSKSRQTAVTSVDMPSASATGTHHGVHHGSESARGSACKTMAASSGSTGSKMGFRLGVPRLTIRQPSIDEPPHSIEIPDDDEVFNPYGSADGGELASGSTASWYSSVTSDSVHLQQRAKKQDSGESRISSGYAGDAMTSSRDELDEVADTPATGAPSSASSDGRKPPRFIWKRFHLNPSASSASSTDSAWKSLDSFTWRSVDGSEFHLRGTRLESLSEIERQALQKIAVVRLNKLLPGVNISRPKDSIALKQKRHKLIKSGRSHTVNILDKKHSANDPKPVFGISISECLQNDLRLETEQRCRSLDESEGGYLNVPRTRNSRSSTSSSKSAYSEPETIEAESKSSGSAHSAPRPAVSADGRFVSSDSLTPAGSQLHKSASATSSTASSTLPKQDSFEPHLPQVPKIVEIYTDYLKKHGLSTVGLFRVAGSAKRCRQMRVELDSGEIVLFDDDDPGDYQPHDIATLLKEYFRDLPDALLSKELYPAYLAAAKLCVEDRVECIRLLLSLLASANSDTALVLLKFLQNVASRAQDEYDSNGELIAVGNKMDAHNLATIFAPSILRPDHSKLQATLNESEAQIIIVETMIEYVDEIFAIPKDFQCQIFNKLREIEPDGLDKLLYQRSRYENAADDCPGPLESSQVYTTTTEEDYPEEFRQNLDGSISIRTKTVTTQRTIVKHGFSCPRVSPNRSRTSGPSPSPSPRPRSSPRFGRNSHTSAASEQQFFGQNMSSASGGQAGGSHQHTSAPLLNTQSYDDASREERQLIAEIKQSTISSEAHAPPLAHIDDDETTIEPETSLAQNLSSTSVGNNNDSRSKRHMKGKLAKMGGFVKDRFRAQS